MHNRLTLVLAILFVGTATLLVGCQSQSQAEAEATPETSSEFPRLSEMWRLETALDRPESAIFDAARNVIYVTNLVGEGDVLDGDGYIAKISSEGAVLEERWIDGLNAPKGIAIAGNTLWASDINRLVEIDLDANAIVNTYSIDGDAYLNDVSTHPDGSVFVSDSRYSKIYRLTDGNLEVWLEDPQIQMPNGVHVIGDELVVVAGDATAENPGRPAIFRPFLLLTNPSAPLIQPRLMVHSMPLSQPRKAVFSPPTGPAVASCISKRAWEPRYCSNLVRERLIWIIFQTLACCMCP